MSVVSGRKAFPSLRENTSKPAAPEPNPRGNQQTQPNHSQRHARPRRKNNNENPELLEKGGMRSRQGSIMDRASSGGQMAEQADRTGREADRRERGKANGRAAHQPASCPQATRRRAGGRPAAGARGGAERGTSRRAERRTAEKAGGADEGRADRRKGRNSRGKGARRGTQQTEQHGHGTRRCEAPGSLTTRYGQLTYKL